MQLHRCVVVRYVTMTTGQTDLSVPSTGYILANTTSNKSMIGEIDFSVSNFKVGPLDNIHNFCWTLAFPISLTRFLPSLPQSSLYPQNPVSGLWSQATSSHGHKNIW